MDEEWRIIKDFPKYSVSNKGNVKNNKRGRIMKQYKDKDGYCILGLYNNEGIQKLMKAHRLVAIEFLSNPLNKPVVNHIDGNKSNNCVDNLEWNTYSENERHKHDVLGYKDTCETRYKKGSWSRGRKFTKEHRERISKSLKNRNKNI